MRRVDWWKALGLGICVACAALVVAGAVTVVDAVRDW